jgi:hypothetical protein
MFSWRLARRARGLVPAPHGCDHIGLKVKDVDVSYAKLNCRGFTFATLPTAILNGRIAFSKEPDDISIELIQGMT